MTYHDLHRLQFDLETTSLDPARGRIFLVAIRDNRGFEQVLEAATPEEEAKLIHTLCKLIRERDPDTIENHNLMGFDLPFLEYRARVLKVPLLLGREGVPNRLESYEETGYAGYRSFRRQRFSVAGRELIDTLDAVRRYDFVVRTLPSYRLKEVARHFGLASPERVYIEGARVYETYQQDPDAVRRYALDDVREVDGLSQRLMGAAFALAGMAPRRYERIASAGPAMGILEPLLVRAYLRAGAALPKIASDQEETFGRHQGGATYLLDEGVAEHLVKADVASLYPSLMRAYRIGPSCDHLGVFLHLIDRLTELRLFHKAAARSAPLGSLEADEHEGTQAAMKTMINAAYGYMGATSMALFGDLGAANEVTRRGRALLDQIIEALRERGMVPIEADTDGVYFATPKGWSEAEERVLADEIGATLPAGIRLEYESRYAAMVSHAIKNYALLSYSGELLVRGAAMRSSRSEPFGVRFLLQAFRCAMQDDIAGIVQCYRDTHRMLLGNASYPPLMWRRACVFLRTRKPTWPSGRNTRRRNTRRCSWLAESSGVPVSACASTVPNRGFPYGCLTRPMTLLRSLTRSMKMRPRKARNCSSLLHRFLPSSIAETTTVSTTCVYCATPMQSGCAWCLRPRTTYSSSAWTGSRGCLIDPLNTCGFAGYAVSLQRQRSEDKRSLAKEGHAVQVSLI
jgi:DNA polymerase, archaea type